MNVVHEIEIKSRKAKKLSNEKTATVLFAYLNGDRGRGGALRQHHEARIDFSIPLNDGIGLLRKFHFCWQRFFYCFCSLNYVNRIERQQTMNRSVGIQDFIREVCLFAKRCNKTTIQYLDFNELKLTASMKFVTHDSNYRTENIKLPQSC